MTKLPEQNNHIRNLQKRNKNLTKYEEVICKSILAYDAFFKSFLLDTESRDLISIVNNIFNQRDFDGYDVLAKLIINSIYETKGNNNVDFLPTQVEKEIDTNVEKKFLIGDI